MTAPRARGALSLVFALLAVACSSRRESVFDDANDAGAHASAEAGAACRVASDCAPGLACAFAIADGCTARGVCVHEDIGACLGGVGCACDGTPTSSCGMGAYADKPFAHAGPCGAGAPCTVSGDECGPGLACGFHGCTPGVCVTATAGTGTCGARPVCGCDGITTTSPGCPLDDGSTRGPFAHDGPCDDGGVDAGAD